MKLKKLIAGMLLVMMVAAVFTGCKKEESTGEDNSLQKVKDAGKLVLGLDDSFPPMGFRNEDNKIVGFDIDVATEVCKRMGVELELQPIDWNAKEMELNSGNIDCIWNGMSIDASRQEKMNLSEPYLRNEMIFVVAADSGIETFADLADKAVAVQNGSTAQTILENSDVYDTLKEATSFDDNVTAFLTLEAGGCQAVFLDSVVAEYYITENDKDFVILEENLQEEEYAIGFRKADQKLRDEVQKILSEMKKDGTLGEISAKWFGSDITIVE